MAGYRGLSVYLIILLENYEQSKNYNLQEESCQTKEQTKFFIFTEENEKMILFIFLTSTLSLFDIVKGQSCTQVIIDLKEPVCVVYFNQRLGAAHSKCWSR